MLNERVSLKSKIDIFGLLLSTSFSLVGWGFFGFYLHTRQIKGICVLCIFKVSFDDFVVPPLITLKGFV